MKIEKRPPAIPPVEPVVPIQPMDARTPARTPPQTLAFKGKPATQAGAGVPKDEWVRSPAERNANTGLYGPDGKMLG